MCWLSVLGDGWIRIGQSLAAGARKAPIFFSAVFTGSRVCNGRETADMLKIA
jgi:hypothetical protein